MLNIKQIFDDIYIIIAKKQSFFEFLLNLSFILIILIILIILYWDNINRNIINKGRCKIVINHEDITFNVDIKQKENKTNLLSISYDNSEQKNVKVDCVCPSGNTPNQFNIPIWNNSENKVQKIEKTCYCDTDYNSSIKNTATGLFDSTKVYVEGDAFLEDYYNGLLDSYSSSKNDYHGINFEKYTPY